LNNQKCVILCWSGPIHWNILISPTLVSVKKSSIWPTMDKFFRKIFSVDGVCMNTKSSLLIQIWMKFKRRFKIQNLYTDMFRQCFFRRENFIMKFKLFILYHNIQMFSLWLFFLPVYGQMPKVYNIIILLAFSLYYINYENIVLFIYCQYGAMMCSFNYNYGIYICLWNMDDCMKSF
jgi:hypothetical protein